MTRPSLLCDDRKESARAFVLKEALERKVPTQVLTLPSGDYVAYFPSGTSLGIERKELGDMLSSLREGRLQVQIGRLAATYTIPVLLLEGILEEDRDGLTVVRGRTTGWKAQAVHSVLMGIQDQGVRIALATTTALSARRILGLYEYYSKDQHSAFHEDPLGFRFVHESPQVSALSALPGVGPKTAKALLRVLGSLEEVATAQSTSLGSVDGVGSKRAGMIREAMMRRFDLE